MIATEFHDCIVCGGSVLCMVGTSPHVAMCASHSDADKLKALAKAEHEINEARKEINERGN